MLCLPGSSLSDCPVSPLREAESRDSQRVLPFQPPHNGEDPRLGGLQRHPAEGAILEAIRVSHTITYLVFRLFPGHLYTASMWSKLSSLRNRFLALSTI